MESLTPILSGGRGVLPEEGMLIAGRPAASGIAPDRVLTRLVKCELIRVRTQPDGITFLGALVVEPGLDNIAGKDVSFEQKLVVFLQRIERGFERSGAARDLGQLFGGQVVEILVERSPGLSLFMMPSRPAINIAANARYGLQEGSGKRTSIRLALGLGSIPGMRIDAERARGIGQVDGGLEAGHEALVGVGGRGYESAKRRASSDASDVPQGRDRYPGIFVAGKERLTPPSRCSGGCACPIRYPRTAVWA